MIDRYPTTHYAFSDEVSKKRLVVDLLDASSLLLLVPAFWDRIPEKVGPLTCSTRVMRLCSRSLALAARLIEYLQRALIGFAAYSFQWGDNVRDAEPTHHGSH